MGAPLLPREELVFGPVPSRRLGRSLGVNNIPPKHCSYSCVYCQIGRTVFLEAKRRKFYDPETLVDAVSRKISEVGLDSIDYVTFVPDGEPTLDVNLGIEARKIKEYAPVKLAVITNGSLLWMDSVQMDLNEFDWVSVKVDAVEEKTYRRIDRPHPSLSLEQVLSGIKEFAGKFPGQLVTETMLVEGLNDNVETLSDIADFIAGLNPSKAYIAVPTRPPAEKWVRPPSPHAMLVAYQVFRERIGDKVEFLASFEGGDFYFGDNVESSILSITNVHPLRLDVAERIIREKGLEPSVIIGRLEHENKIQLVDYEGHVFIVRRPRKS